MDFKEALASRRQSAVAVFHKFRVDTSIHNRFHVFVEGYEDVSFYSRYAPRTNADEAKFHVCFGKKNIDKILCLYRKSGIDTDKAVFVRDSDFDSFLGNAPQGQNVFLTCGYSVENYVCSEEALSAYLSKALCLDESEIDLRGIVSSYSALASKLHKWLFPLYGATMYALRQGRNIDLNKLKIYRHISRLIAGDEMHEIIDIDELPSIGITVSDFNDESIMLGERFSELPALHWLRGKYLLVLATVFLRNEERKFHEMHKKGLLSQFNRKTAGQINESGIFERLSAWAEPTERLRREFQRCPNV